MGKRKFKIGVVGSFQSGKSLILNCLAGKNTCPVGNGLETTQSIRWIKSINCDWASFFDTQGFGGKLLPASEAPALYGKFDFLLFVSGGVTNRMLDLTQLELLAQINDANVPFSIVYNVSASDGSSEEFIVDEVANQLNERGIIDINIFGKCVFPVRPFQLENIQSLGGTGYCRRDRTKASNIEILKEFLGIIQSQRIMTLKQYAGVLNDVEL